MPLRLDLMLGYLLNYTSPSLVRVCVWSCTLYGLLYALVTATVLVTPPGPLCSLNPRRVPTGGLNRAYLTLFCGPTDRPRRYRLPRPCVMSICSFPAPQRFP